MIKVGDTVIIDNVRGKYKSYYCEQGPFGMGMYIGRCGIVSKVGGSSSIFGLYVDVEGLDSTWFKYSEVRKISEDIK